MLNDYQFQLIESFVDLDVNFIVIGGMALKFHTGKQTRDLDLWVPVTGSNKDRLGKALHAWEQRYSAHFPYGGLAIEQLRENVQIHFPETDACYLDVDGNIRDISPDDGIDILTSIQCCLEFDVASDRSSDWFYKGVELRVLALEDVKRLHSYNTSS